jgi:hypothetical protein
MKTHRWGRLIALLVLTALILTACQPMAVEIAYQPDDTGTIDAVAKSIRAVTQATLIGEGFVLPTDEMQVPTGWQVLKNDYRGYSLVFLLVWNVCQETEYSWTFCDNQEDPAWMGLPLRLYVSVFPKDYTNSDWEVYNFIPTVTIQEFIALPIGESKLKEPGSPRPDYTSYTRLPDQTAAGLNAPVIENSKLWGMPPETKERVVFLVTEDTTYILGMYYETPEQLALFEQVLDSFQSPP